MKTNRHTLMAKGIMVLLTLLILVFIITFAWFTPPEEDNDAHGISVKTKAGSDFEYAIGFQTSQTGGEYLVTNFTSLGSEQWDIEHLSVPGHSDTYNLIYDYSPIDITGDGVTLIRPNMEYGNWKINTGTNDYSVAEANTQYISFDIIVRSKSQSIISLGPQSYAVGDCETNNNEDLPDGSKLVNNNPQNITRKSDYGNFSRDAIVGAVRVAFIDFVNDGSITADSLTQSLQDDKLATTPSLLWVPRPDVYLSNNPVQDSDPTHTATGTNHDEDTSGWGLITGVSSDRTFNLQSKAMNDSAYTTYRHQQYDIFNNTHNSVVTNNDSYVHVSSKDTSDNCYRFNDLVDLFPLSYSKTVVENNQNVTYYYGKIRVRIWVEGTDTESRRALAGGKFRFNFDLTNNG